MGRERVDQREKEEPWASCRQSQSPYATALLMSHNMKEFVTQVTPNVLKSGAATEPCWDIKGTSFSSLRMGLQIQEVTFYFQPPLGFSGSTG